MMACSIPPSVLQWRYEKKERNKHPLNARSAALTQGIGKEAGRIPGRSYGDRNSQTCRDGEGAMTSGIYQIRNTVNGKCYIGSSVDTEGRWWTHHWQLINGSHHNVYLQRSWNKYGRDAFVFEILEEIDTEFLLDREQSYLDALFKDLYNISPTAGSTLGAVNGPLSEEHRLKISKANKGRIVPESARKAVAEANRRRIISEETRRKKSKPLSDEHKQKIAEGNRGKSVSEETRQKLSAVLRGKPKSEESKRKLSEAWKKRRERGVSEETRQKLSEANKRRWEAIRAANKS